jgi:two-component system nitrate/nitrite response regulator NarL
VTQLTTREMQVARLVSSGLTDKEAAALLGISRFTLRNHMTKILIKCKVRNRTELARMELGRVE